VRRAVAIGLLAAVIVAAGCGGTTSAPPSPLPRSPLAVKLGALCDRARLDIEALGLPSEQGIAVVAPTVRIGRRLAAQIGALHGRTALERTRLEAISHNLDSYYLQVKGGLDAYKLAGGAGFQVAVEGAKPALDRAETLATRLGAPECAKHAFDDYQPS